MILSKPENPSSEKLQRQRVQQLIGRVAKRAKHPYRQAIERRERDEFNERRKHVFTKLRLEMSLERFKDLMHGYWQLGPFQQRKFVDQWETHFYERRTASRPVSPGSRD